MLQNEGPLATIRRRPSDRAPRRFRGASSTRGCMCFDVAVLRELAVTRHCVWNSTSVRNLESSLLTFDSHGESGFDALLGHSITYRIALRPHQGRKAFTLHTMPAAAESSDGKLTLAVRLTRGNREHPHLPDRKRRCGSVSDSEAPSPDARRVARLPSQTARALPGLARGRS